MAERVVRAGAVTGAGDRVYLEVPLSEIGSRRVDELARAAAAAGPVPSPLLVLAVACAR